MIASVEHDVGWWLLTAYTDSDPSRKHGAGLSTQSENVAE